MNDMSGERSAELPNANVVAGSASAAAKPVPAATPTEMMASAADSDDDIEDGEPGRGLRPRARDCWAGG